MAARQARSIGSALPPRRMIEKAVMRQLGRTFTYLATWFGCLLFMIPFWWTVVSSFKDLLEIRAYPPTFFPKQLLWSNYLRVFQVSPYLQWTWNSIIVTVLTVIGEVVTASIVAYSFARFRYPYRDTLFVICLSTMMLPAQVTLVPTYLGFRYLGWLNTFRPLIVPAYFGGGAFNIFLLRQFLMTIPLDLDEAARIDGAGIIRIFVQILLPQIRPALATVMVLGFLNSWNDYMGPLIYLNRIERFTLALGLQWFKDVDDSGIGLESKMQYMMAACVMATFPCIVLFFAGQKYFVRGVVMSGIKG